jgi:hypothetical protein
MNEASLKRSEVLNLLESLYWDVNTVDKAPIHISK